MDEKRLNQLLSDCDNWLVIPEFHVNPVDVMFEGFAFPIYRHDKHGWEDQISEIVKEIRNHARILYKTQASLRYDYASLLEKSSEWDDFGNGVENATPNERFAFWYMDFFDLLDSLYSLDKRKRTEREHLLVTITGTAMRLAKISEEDKGRVRSETARKGAEETNKRHADNQEFVFKWLDANYQMGMKHKEMAVTLVPLLDGEREYETILKDITEWKKKRKR